MGRRGRPAIDGIARTTVGVSLSEIERDFLARYGAGNVSAGCRRAIKVCMGLSAAAAQQRRAGIEPGDESGVETSPVGAEQVSAPLGSPAVTGGAAQSEQRFCRSPYCECEQGKCGAGLIDARNF